VPDDGAPAAGGRALLERATAQLREVNARPSARWLTEGDGDMSEHSRGLSRPALDRLADAGERLAARLAQPGQVTWTHGDFHLGHLGHTLLRRQWRLIDVDTVGVGDPAWDLARPAAFYAAGLLDRPAWSRFLAAYREAGGPAVPADGDAWGALELPARAAALIAACPLLGRLHAEATADALLSVAWGAQGTADQC
jgi:aminoglycoside phosphotransferase (APT) family kinase protein